MTRVSPQRRRAPWAAAACACALLWLVAGRGHAATPERGGPPTVATPPAVATPPTVASPQMTAFGQVGARWDALFSDVGDRNAFELQRAQLGLGALWGQGAGLQLTLEGVRSAGPNGVLGVAGDAILARLRHGFAFVRHGFALGVVTLRAGLVPDPWLEAVQADYGLRGFAPVLGVRAGVLSPSDLGVSLRWTGRWATLRLSLLNGEGRDQLERNPGKNLTAVLTLAPWRPTVLGQRGRLHLHLGLRDGSVGAGEVRDHRVFAGLIFVHPRYQAGISGLAALGVAGRSERVLMAGSAWLAAAVWRDRVGVFARQDEVDAQRDVPSAAWSTTAAGVYVDLVPSVRTTAPRRLRIFIGWQRARFGARSGPIAGAPVAARGDHVMVVVEAIDLSRVPSPGREVSP